jgi:ribA/ribD-fused uncharacterized protein
MKDQIMSDVRTTAEFVFFWSGWPSQWAKCRFEINGVTYNCCEQFMMAEKARVFDDADAAQAILAAKSPRDQKALGRTIRGFRERTWNAVCRGIVYCGNLAKFSQDAQLRELLLGTGHRTIVEASPKDPIWGIGLSQDDPQVENPSQWQGTNWLGVALMQVRDELRRQVGESAQPLDNWLAEQLRARETIGIKE